MAAIKHVMDERKKVDKIMGVSSAIPKDYDGKSSTSTSQAN
jgi:hypothetical protein